jgi:hypothetical protein
MMSFDEFITKWTGKPIDTDNAFGAQCMDLMHKYVEEVLGLPDKSLLAAPSASQAYTNFTATKYFKKIDNTLLGVPNKGDIVFFGPTVGNWGHVCVYISGSVMGFKSFDQNWPVSSYPHIQDHNYKGVLGWLRPIPQVDDKYLNALKQIKVIVDNLA